MATLGKPEETVIVASFTLPKGRIRFLQLTDAIVDDGSGMVPYKVHEWGFCWLFFAQDNVPVRSHPSSCEHDSLRPLL